MQMTQAETDLGKHTQWGLICLSSSEVNTKTKAGGARMCPAITQNEEDRLTNGDLQCTVRSSCVAVRRFLSLQPILWKLRLRFETWL